MLHGKKGFDRLLYACKNVLAAPMTWLYSTYDQGEFYSIFTFRPRCAQILET